MATYERFEGTMQECLAIMQARNAAGSTMPVPTTTAATVPAPARAKASTPKPKATDKTARDAEHAAIRELADYYGVKHGKGTCKGIIEAAGLKEYPKSWIAMLQHIDRGASQKAVAEKATAKRKAKKSTHSGFMSDSFGMHDRSDYATQSEFMLAVNATCRELEATAK
jgi:hypothetical protein